jgi:sucrose-6-phosphate hydrolase SacC (GH32 family)
MLTRSTTTNFGSAICLGSVLLIATVIICLGQGVFGAEFPCHYPKTTEPPGRHFPYVDTDYQEDYRGQFHFSAKNGHINDVNGPIYIDGVYHLYYQHYPYAIHSVHKSYMKNARGFWGHATSTDLMHWKQEPVALDPHHIPGGSAYTPSMYSGTSVIDWKNTSGLKTGKNDVAIIMFTGYGYTPNMLAFSNDNGWTWENYKGNGPSPKGILEDGERDPKIFWYEPTKQWILNIYDANPTPYSSSFYSSPDLKKWTYKSAFGAGEVFECTDMYEIRVDGNPDNKRWVFSHADTRYWIGKFDGTNFNPTEVTSKQPKEKLCPTGEVYAGLVWGNLPDDRVVYQGWMKSQALTDAAVAAGKKVRWEHELTFPWEIKLKTYPEGMRLTRNPIAEIANIYSSTSKWRNKTITKTSKNLLADKQSKCYRITTVFDLTGTTATQFGFELHQSIGVFCSDHNADRVASRAFNGDTTGATGTGWEAPGTDPQWIYIDLGETRNIDRVKLYWQAAYAKAYKIQVSKDAVKWKDLYETEKGDGGIDNLTGLKGRGRYVRLYATQRGTGFGYHLFEMEVYDGASKNRTVSAGRDVMYNVTNSTLSGFSMPPENGKVKIDILVDWGQLEIFGNHGKLSLAYTVPWDKKSLGMALRANGKVKLDSMEYHDISSTWLVGKNASKKKSHSKKLKKNSKK